MRCVYGVCLWCVSIWGVYGVCMGVCMGVCVYVVYMRCVYGVGVCVCM